MLKTTYISRETDGLVLFESIDTAVTDPQVNRLKNRAKELMANMTQVKHDELSLNIEDHCLHLKRYNGCVIMVLSEVRYPQQLAFQYLAEIQDLVQEECRKKFGSNSSVDYGSKIETIESPYAFQNMERALNKLKKDYRDSNSQINVERLNKELLDINNIMRDNFELILNRDSTLNTLSGKATNLRESSKKYKDNARKLKMSFYWKKYGTIAMIVGVFVIFIMARIWIF